MSIHFPHENGVLTAFVLLQRDPSIDLLLTSLQCFLCRKFPVVSKGQPRRRYEEQTTLFKQLFMTPHFRRSVSPPTYNCFANQVDSCGGCLPIIKEVYALHHEIVAMQTELDGLLDKARSAMSRTIQPKRKLVVERKRRKIDNDTDLEGLVNFDVKEEELDDSFEEIIVPDFEEEPQYEERPILIPRKSKAKAAKMWRQVGGSKESDENLEDDANDDPNFDQVGDDAGDGKNVFSCAKCGKTLSNKSSLIRHEIVNCQVPYDADKLKRYNIKLYPCNLCDKKYTCQRDLNRHFAIHTKQKPLLTSGNMSIPQESNPVIKMVKRKTNKKLLPCTKCGKNLLTSKSSQECRDCIYAMVRKISIPVDGNSNEEDATDPEFSSKTIPPTEYSCLKCGKHLKSLRQKISHEVTVCKITYDDDELARLNIKFHQCLHCPRKFMHYKDLTKHGVKHSKVNSFVCDKCGKAFRYSVSLSAHQKIHCTEVHIDPEERQKFHQKKVASGVRHAVKCPQCPHRFVQRAKLLRHLASSVHEMRFRPDGEDSVVCSACGKCVSSEIFAIKQHIVSIHEKEDREESGDDDDERFEGFDGPSENDKLTELSIIPSERDA